MSSKNLASTHLESAGFCIDKNYTKIIPLGKDKATFEIIPGITQQLGIGEHTFSMYKFSFKCTHHIKVVVGRYCWSLLQFGAPEVLDGVDFTDVKRLNNTFTLLHSNKN